MLLQCHHTSLTEILFSMFYHFFSSPMPLERMLCICCGYDTSVLDCSSIALCHLFDVVFEQVRDKKTRGFVQNSVLMQTARGERACNS